MSKFNWVLSTLLVTALISSVPSSTQTTRAQTNRSGSGSLTKDNPPPADPVSPMAPRRGTSRAADPVPPVEPRRGTSRGPSGWATIFQALVQDNQPPEDAKKGGSRGLCAIAPKAIGTNTEIWSDRPLFVWKGRIERIELRSTDSDRVLWKQSVEGKNRVLYDGKALQPGQTYEWRLFFSDQENAQPIKTERFRVMDAQERDRIKAQLQTLEEQLKAEQISPEDIARRRAQYFAKQRLWSDVLQEAYSVENPSASLTAMVQAIPREICTSQPSEQNSTQPR